MQRFLRVRLLARLAASRSKKHIQVAKQSTPWLLITSCVTQGAPRFWSDNLVIGTDQNTAILETCTLMQGSTQSTLNAVPRFTGRVERVLENSKALIDDAGSIDFEEFRSSSTKRRPCVKKNIFYVYLVCSLVNTQCTSVRVCQHYS